MAEATKVIEPDEELQILDRKASLRSKRKFWILKRAQDIILSGLALMFLSPLMIFIAAIIYLDDPKGSPIFYQICCGRNVKEFKLYKFRSMCVDAEKKLAELLKINEMDGPAFKIKDDPRITKIGKFIRKTTIHLCEC